MSHTRIALFLLFSILPLRAFASDPPAAALPADTTVIARVVYEPAGDRPKALVGLYAASIALNGYDTYSTLAALRAGNVELNPLMKPIVGNPALFVTVKATITAATILSAEQLWRKHQRKQAVMVMIISNTLMAVVDARNAAVLRGRR